MWDKLIGLLGGNLFTGVTDLVKAFKLPPEQQIAFEQKMAELESTTKQALEKIAAEDRASARQREMTVKDATPAILAYLSIACFAGLTAAIVFHGIPVDAHDIIVAIVAWLGGFVSGVFGYYFGSSAGSQEKNVLLGRK